MFETLPGVIMTMDPWILAGLLVASLFTSLMSALAGFGGGVLLLVIMAAFINPVSLIPVQGLIQMGSNCSRIYAYRAYLSFDFVKKFLIGAIPGVILATLVVSALPPETLLVSISLFVLVTAWMPARLPIGNSRVQVIVIGTIVTFLSMFVGSTGPLLAPVFKSLGYTKQSFVSTMAVCLFCQNILKALAFGTIGFDLLYWLPFIILMATTGFFGTLLGALLHGKLNEAHFSLLVKWVMTLLAINILWKTLL